MSALIIVAALVSAVLWCVLLAADFRAFCRIDAARDASWIFSIDFLIAMFPGGALYLEHVAKRGAP